jgi:hypothetical protein
VNGIEIIVSEFASNVVVVNPTGSVVMLWAKAGRDRTALAANSKKQEIILGTGENLSEGGRSVAKGRSLDGIAWNW